MFVHNEIFALWKVTQRRSAVTEISDQHTGTFFRSKAEEGRSDSHRGGKPVITLFQYTGALFRFRVSLSV
jgi:hypothetical protein